MKAWRYANPDEVKSSSCRRLNLLKGDILATVEPKVSLHAANRIGRNYSPIFIPKKEEGES